MTDFLGNELNLGDDVVYVFFCKTSSYLIKSKVEKMIIYPKLIAINKGVEVMKKEYVTPVMTGGEIRCK